MLQVTRLLLDSRPPSRLCPLDCGCACRPRLLLLCFGCACAARAGWEMQTTDQGVPYYVDHFNKRTSWDPPIMSSGGMSVIASELPDIREQR